MLYCGKIQQGIRPTKQRLLSNIMSHFADLKFANYPIWSMQNIADPIIMELFSDKERFVYSKRGDYEEDYRVYEYRSTVKKFIQRLEILGHSLKKAIKSFNAGVEKLLEEMNLTDFEYETFSKFDFETWKKCMQFILVNGLSKWNIDEHPQGVNIPEDLRPYIDFILGIYTFEESRNEPEYYFVGSFQLGFSIYASQDYGRSYMPSAEVHDLFRAILDVCDISDSVTLDYGSLIAWGTYTEEEDITEEPAKIIVLTEGSIDREFLERTLNILYPELSKYYFFLDFHSSNLQGGASSVTHLVKGFVGAKIFNRTIAVLDNDTAAFDALRSLRDVVLPDTIKVVNLPRLSLAENYPTIGAQGSLSVDINGKACSLEIYFGKNVLCDSRGNLTPIQWAGFNNVLGQYNGEIINKKEIQEKYRKLLDDVEGGQIKVDDSDWSGMRTVFETIFSAFNNEQ